MKRLPVNLWILTPFSAMEERNKLLRIYGPDLCAEEANAVANMMRMFSLSPLFEEEDDDAGVFDSSNEVGKYFPHVISNRMELKKIQCYRHLLGNNLIKFVTRQLIEVANKIDSFNFGRIKSGDRKIASFGPERRETKNIFQAVQVGCIFCHLEIWF